MLEKVPGIKSEPLEDLHLVQIVVSNSEQPGRKALEKFENQIKEVRHLPIGGTLRKVALYYTLHRKETVRVPITRACSAKTDHSMQPPQALHTHVQKYMWTKDAYT